MHAANTRFVMVAYSARAFFWLPSFDFFLEHWETIPVLFQIYFINFQILIPKKETDSLLLKTVLTSETMNWDAWRRLEWLSFLNWNFGYESSKQQDNT